MMYDFAPKLAQVVTRHSTRISAGDYVVITANAVAAPLIEALYEEVLRLGAHPVIDMQLDGLAELKIMLGDDEQLGFVDPRYRVLCERADVVFRVEGPSNTKGLGSAELPRMQLAQQAIKGTTELLFKRVGEGSLRYCILPWPTPAGAQQAEMGTHNWTRFLYRACGLDHPDPVAYWQSLRDRQASAIDYLSRKRHLDFHGPDIELSLSIEGRTWVNCHGTMNIPDGEIYTSPIEDSAAGWVSFNMRSVYANHEVEGVRLRFERGEVVEASAARGEAFLKSQLALDEGARRLGEVALGMNSGIDRVTGITLFDEKIGGSIHLAVGTSAPYAGGSNKSIVHWDMVHSMKSARILADGELFYQNGQLLI